MLIPSAPINAIVGRVAANCAFDLIIVTACYKGYCGGCLSLQWEFAQYTEGTKDLLEVEGSLDWQSKTSDLKPLGWVRDV